LKQSPYSVIYILSVVGADFKREGLFVMSKRQRWQEESFVAGPLSSLVSDDHILKQVDRVLDLS
jgi:hypothetical protein